MIIKALDVCILHFFGIFAAGALLFFALLGLSGCFITCYDRRVRNDLAQPCRELCLCCCQPGYNYTLFAVVCITDANKLFLFLVCCVIVGILIASTIYKLVGSFVYSCSLFIFSRECLIIIALLFFLESRRIIVLKFVNLNSLWNGFLYSEFLLLKFFGYSYAGWFVFCGNSYLSYICIIWENK